MITDFRDDDKDFEDFEGSDMFERLNGVGVRRHFRLTREESLATYLASVLRTTLEKPGTLDP